MHSMCNCHSTIITLVIHFLKFSPILFLPQLLKAAGGKHTCLDDVVAFIKEVNASPSLAAPIAQKPVGHEADGEAVATTAQDLLLAVRGGELKEISCKLTGVSSYFHVVFLIAALFAWFWLRN